MNAAESNARHAAAKANRSAESATAKVYALTGRIITGASYNAVANKYYALTGRIL